MSNPEKKNKKFYGVSKQKAILVCVFLFAVVFGLGYYISYVRNLNWTRGLISDIIPVRENNFNYHFTYPLLGYNYNNALYLLEDNSLEKQINNYIQTEYQNHNTDNTAVYYRNLLNNRWSSVNADVQYHPGSMMKVTVAMAYYRQSQLDLNYSVMDKEFTFSDAINKIVNSQPHATPTNLTVGQSYSTEYLIEDAIENSDNGADILLLNNVDHKILDDIFNNLSIENPDKTNDFTISAAQYADFLRILYNATYLNEDNSEKILSIMSKATFHNGISAGIPVDINAAQKYGEYLDTNATRTNVNAIELSNCGIVYTSDNPYELCVMTKGSYDGKSKSDEQRLASIIKDVSSIVYNYVSASGKK